MPTSKHMNMKYQWLVVCFWTSTQSCSWIFKNNFTLCYCTWNTL